MSGPEKECPSCGSTLHAALFAPCEHGDPDLWHSVEWIARLFHETYERLAPEYGYKPRAETSVPWAEVPEPNKSLMIATVANLAPRLRDEFTRESASAHKQELLGLAETFEDWASTARLAGTPLIAHAYREAASLARAKAEEEGNGK